MNPDTIAQAKAADLLQLAAHYTKLTRASSTELEGPCPKCGGTDRMHVKADMFFCRQCYPLDNNKPHDAIAFLQWAEGCTFPEAITMLTGDTLTRTPRQQPAPKMPHKEPQPESWRTWAAEYAQASRAALPNSPGADYLNSRCLWPDTWAAFGLGYTPEATRVLDIYRVPAIVIPWSRGGTTVGIKYRFLKPVGKERLRSAGGSDLLHLLFGGQAFPADISPDARSHRHLLIIEGEINAMSAWQAMNTARLDVLSLAGESPHIPESFFPVAAQYRTRIVWMDKEARARVEAARIEAAALWSEEGGKKTDANDHLRAGTLADVLALALQRAGKSEHAEALTFDLYDAA